MFTIAELAEKIRRSRSKAYDLVKKGKIGHYRIDGAIFVAQSDIDTYLASCRVEPRKKQPLPALLPCRKVERLTLD